MGVQSIDRAVAILRCFDGRQPQLGISEIARITGLSTSTVHRLLGSMQENGLVRHAGSRRYALGPLLVRLASSGALPRALRDAAEPFMVALRDEIEETVGLHELLPSGQRIVVAQVESHHELRRTYTDIGVPIRLVHGAPGKAILSVLPDEERAEQLAAPVERLTETTVTDREAIEAELVRAREVGYCSSNAQRTAGIRAVASPVFDHSGRVVGALGTSVPVVRMDDARSAELGLRVRQVAWQVSTVLGATAEVVHTHVPDLALGLS